MFGLHTVGACVSRAVKAPEISLNQTVTWTPPSSSNTLPPWRRGVECVVQVSGGTKGCDGGQEERRNALGEANTWANTSWGLKRVYLMAETRGVTAWDRLAKTPHLGAITHACTPHTHTHVKMEISTTCDRL